MSADTERETCEREHLTCLAKLNSQALELPVLPLLRCRLSSFLLGTLPMHHTIAAPSAAMSPASGAFPAGVERLPCLGRFPCGNAYEGNSRDIDLRRLR